MNPGRCRPSAKNLHCQIPLLRRLWLRTVNRALYIPWEKSMRLNSSRRAHQSPYLCPSQKRKRCQNGYYGACGSTPIGTRMPRNLDSWFFLTRFKFTGSFSFLPCASIWSVSVLQHLVISRMLPTMLVALPLQTLTSPSWWGMKYLDVFYIYSSTHSSLRFVAPPRLPNRWKLTKNCFYSTVATSLVPSGNHVCASTPGGYSQRLCTLGHCLAYV